jgi:hypothetical protein
MLAVVLAVRVLVRRERITTPEALARVTSEHDVPMAVASYYRWVTLFRKAGKLASGRVDSGRRPPAGTDAEVQALRVERDEARCQLFALKEAYAEVETERAAAVSAANAQGETILQLRADLAAAGVVAREAAALAEEPDEKPPRRVDLASTIRRGQKVLREFAVALSLAEIGREAASEIVDALDRLEGAGFGSKQEGGQ